MQSTSQALDTESEISIEDDTTHPLDAANLTHQSGASGDAEGEYFEGYELFVRLKALLHTVPDFAVSFEPTMLQCFFILKVLVTNGTGRREVAKQVCFSV